MHTIAFQATRPKLLKLSICIRELSLTWIMFLQQLLLLLTCWSHTHTHTLSLHFSRFCYLGCTTPSKSIPYAREYIVGRASKNKSIATPPTSTYHCLFPFSHTISNNTSLSLSSSKILLPRPPQQRLHITLLSCPAPSHRSLFSAFLNSSFLFLSRDCWNPKKWVQTAPTQKKNNLS